MKTNEINKIARTVDKNTGKKLSNAKDTLSKIKILKNLLNQMYNKLSEMCDDAMESGSITVGSVVDKTITSAYRDTEKLKETINKLESEITTEDLRNNEEFSSKESDKNFNDPYENFHKSIEDFITKWSKDGKVTKEEIICNVIGYLDNQYPNALEDANKKKNFSKKDDDKSSEIENLIKDYQANDDISILTSESVKEAAKGSEPFGDKDLGDVIASGDTKAIEDYLKSVSNFSDKKSKYHKGSFDEYLKEYAGNSCERGLIDQYDDFVATCKEDGFEEVTQEDYDKYCDYYDDCKGEFSEKDDKCYVYYDKSYNEYSIGKNSKSHGPEAKLRKHLFEGTESQCEKWIKEHKSFSTFESSLKKLNNFDAQADLADADKRLAELSSDKEKKYQEDRKKLAEDYIKDVSKDTETAKTETNEKSGLLDKIKSIGSNLKGALGFSEKLYKLDKLSKKYNK